MGIDIHEANRMRWEAGAKQWAKRADSRGLWQRCPEEPELVLSERELAYLSDIKGRKIAVLGSGDNQIAFALAGLGAHVTSVDISQAQLEVARERAQKLGLEIDFMRADVTALNEIRDGSFYLVYTGGHVAVWVSDITRYYSEAARILQLGGLFVISEYHPFRRVWKGSNDSLEVEHSYFQRGPFEYDASADILEPKTGTLKSYEFHWTFSDYINAVIRSGCKIVEVAEFGEEVADWEGAPMTGLPEFLLIFAQK
ncbi:MAG: class I SAM-dependent methyltransferase [Acidobacteriota bacterium]|nr:MAG: class I SAM-dependent methyltransferase [Acidobacteriota bacterium]